MEPCDHVSQNERQICGSICEQLFTPFSFQDSELERSLRALCSGWILRDTKPSPRAAEWIEAIRTGYPDRPSFKKNLAAALDVRRRTFTTLDVMHVGEALFQFDQGLWMDVVPCPLAKATALSINWDTMTPISQSVAAQLAEAGKELAWFLAATDPDPDYRNAMYRRSAGLAKNATEHLAMMLQADSTWLTGIPSDVQSNYFQATGSFFTDAQSPVRLVAYAANPESDATYTRFLRNLQDAVAGYSAANKLQPADNSFDNAIAMGSLFVTSKSIKQEAVDWGAFTTDLGQLGSDENQGSRIKPWIEGLPTRGTAVLSAEELSQFLKQSAAILTASDDG